MAHAHWRRRAALGLWLGCAAWGAAAQETPVFTAPAPLNPNAVTGSGADTQPHAAGDGQGNWVAVWTSADSFGGLYGTDQDIFAAYSSDDGATWTQPGALNSNASFDSGFDGAPRVATDGRGTWITVWYSRDTLNGAVGEDNDIFFSRSENNGQTWTPVQPLNNDAAFDSRQDLLPQIATDGDDTWVVVWEAFGDDRDIYFARSTDGGLTWGAPAPLNTNAATDSGDDYQATLVHDSVGGFVCVWGSDENLGGVTGTDGDLLFARSVDGAVWSAPEILNLNAATDNSRDQNPSLATDGNGTLVCVWNSPQNFQSAGGDEDIFFARSTNGGATWGPVALLDPPLATTDNAIDTTPTVATDGRGRWIAVWSSGNSLNSTIGIDRDILVKESRDNGATWSATAILNLNAGVDSGDDTHPGIFHAGRAWLAVWESTDSLNGQVGTDSDIHFAQWLEPVLPWEAPAPVNSFASSDTAADLDDAASIAGDGKGVWVAAWQSRHSLGGTLGNDFDILVARSTDNGASWSAAAPLHASAATDAADDRRPAVATDGKGNWVVAWETQHDFFGNGADYDLVAVRSNNNGLTWSSPVLVNGNALADSDDDIRVSLAVSRATGVWIAAWTINAPGGAHAVRVARSVDNGANWTMPVELNPGGDTDRNIRVATDGLNAWVAVWESRADIAGAGAMDYDILTARSVNGAQSWSAPTVLNSHAATDAPTADDTTPAIATDGRGNWLCVWSGTHDGGGRLGTDADLFVARSNNNGATWNLAAPVNRYAPFDGAAADVEPALVFGGGNVWGLAWRSNANLAGQFGADFDIFFATTRNLGQTWSQPQRLNTFNDVPPVDEANPMLATDGRGNWIGAWTGFSAGVSLGVDGDIVARRVRAPNIIAITPDVPVISNAQTVAYTVQFSEPVTGFGVEKIALGLTGAVTGAFFVSLEALSGSDYRLVVDTGSGSGSITVGLFDNDNIFNAEGTPLGGIGLNNGDFFGSAIILDKDPPVLTLLGQSPQTVACFADYVEAGATAIDAVYSDVSAAIVIDAPVDTSRAGSYTVTYTAADPLGNTTTATRTVNVVGDCGAPEGEGGGEAGEGEGDGGPDGEGGGDGETDPRHSGDTNNDGRISLSELLRVIQFFNSGAYHCQPGTEDGYAPGPGAQNCAPHASDYNPPDWSISLSELLRLIQFYNAGGYAPCPEGEDGYCPVFP